jgi:hypothetical protein
LSSLQPVATLAAANDESRWRDSILAAQDALVNVGGHAVKAEGHVGRLCSDSGEVPREARCGLVESQHSGLETDWEMWLVAGMNWDQALELLVRTDVYDRNARGGDVGSWALAVPSVEADDFVMVP